MSSSSNGGKKPAPGGRGGPTIRTLSDINRGPAGFPGAEGGGSDSDEPQEYYTGGEKRYLYPFLSAPLIRSALCVGFSFDRAGKHRNRRRRWCCDVDRSPWLGLVAALYHWYVVRLGFLGVLSVSDVTIGLSPSELRETLKPGRARELWFDL
jgi:hypothetical protein